MKKLLFLIFIGLCSFQGIAQDPDPDLYQTWYLRTIGFDFGVPIVVSFITPPIVPSLTIDGTLDFEGEGACNTFTGTFTYDAVTETLTPVNYGQTIEICVNQEHTDFEIQYFLYFSNDFSLAYQIYTNPSNGMQHLNLGFAPGFYLEFADSILSVPDSVLKPISIYPNPAQDILRIENNSTTGITSIRIYDVLGRLVLAQNSDVNQIDVSHLNSGVLFVKIETDHGVNTKKIIKQ